MKAIFSAVLAAGVAIAAASPALSADGCGRGFHRGPYGHCRPNRGDRVVFTPSIGVYYADRGGYWDGRRYWQHRERWHNGWRYR
jgi:hypothetical protein